VLLCCRLPQLEELWAAQRAAADEQQQQRAGSSAGASGSGRGAESLPELQQQVDEQAALVRELKAAGLTNQDSRVQQHVQVLLKLKARLQQAQEQQHGPAPAEPGGSDGGGAGEPAAGGAAAPQQADGDDAAARPARLIPDEQHPFCRVAIWQIGPQPLFFVAPRSGAKDFAKEVVRALGPPNSLRIA
jgi:hypothetical protein